MRIEIRLPLPDDQIFRYEAMDDILEITAQSPTDEFTNSELQELTGFGGPSVSKALSLLETLGLVVRRDVGRKTLYRIEETRLCEADDPFLEVPQAEFRKPLRAFVDQVANNVPSTTGVVCFGSVARGEADRVSDIDVFVLVDDDDDLVSTRRTVSDVKRDLEANPIDGQRYEFEIFVESAESARNRGEDLRPILKEGIELHETETLDRVKQDVFRGGAE